MRYRHLKTGTLYQHLAIGVDCTNARDGTLMVIYCPLDDDRTIYVRDQAEHETRFEMLNDGEGAFVDASDLDRGPQIDEEE